MGTEASTQRGAEEILGFPVSCFAEQLHISLASWLPGHSYVHGNPVGSTSACHHVCTYACMYVCMYVCFSSRLQQTRKDGTAWKLPQQRHDGG